MNREQMPFEQIRFRKFRQPLAIHFTGTVQMVDRLLSFRESVNSGKFRGDKHQIAFTDEQMRRNRVGIGGIFQIIVQSHNFFAVHDLTRQNLREPAEKLAFITVSEIPGIQHSFAADFDRQHKLFSFFTGQSFMKISGLPAIGHTKFQICPLKLYFPLDHGITPLIVRQIHRRNRAAFNFGKIRRDQYQITLRMSKCGRIVWASVVFSN